MEASEKVSDLQTTTCPNNRCGKTFEKPLELIDLANPSQGGSYVCPFCLSKLESPQPEQEAVVETFCEEKLENVEGQKEGECPHFVGYLSKRPRNAPIPDFCLTCPQMMKCMLG